MAPNNMIRIYLQQSLEFAYMHCQKMQLLHFLVTNQFCQSLLL
uniref:Uncharacterized protein n=1 Tax=Arundo donax TaxID=35708 RepID=A0A0A8YYN8_ARUDO